MATSGQDLPIVVYHYHASPYAKRVIWYLTLRKIPFSQCLQPHVLPRPDVAALGIAYRRIPLMSIGRDVYLDTRLILNKLGQLYPPSAAHPSLYSSVNPNQDRALARLLLHRTMSVFMHAARLLPAAVLSDPAFVRDRAALVGIEIKSTGTDALASAPLAPANIHKARPEALVEAREVIAFLEETLLADGREWISSVELETGGRKTKGPSLVDIEAVWLWHWLHNIPGALSPEVIGKDAFPKVFAWIERFDAFMKEKTKEMGRVKTLGGDQAAELIVRSSFAEPEAQVDGADPVVVAEGFEKGQNVRLWPTDYGFLNKDEGMLVAMNKTEYVIETQGKFGSVRVHSPRLGFKISKSSGATASKI